MLVVDNYSSSTLASTYVLNITEGACPGPGAVCTLEDGTEGTYDCEGVCAADTSGDGTCDAGMFCDEFALDGGDCEAAEPGYPCMTAYSGVGIVSCDGTCEYDYSYGDSSCDEEFDCEALGYDMGACLLAGDVCTMEDGTDGVYNCDKDCVVDTIADGTCDDTFDCEDTEWDGADCDAPVPGDDCTTSTGGVGIVRCDLSCSSYPYWWGDGICDSSFSCSEMDYDMGDCDAPFGEACLTDDETVGIIDCTGGCSEDTRGDGSCDPAFECASGEFDMGDCGMPGPGDSCTTEGGSAGIVGCDLECGYASSYGDSYCTVAYDCAELLWDLGTCVSFGEVCETDEVSGIHGCDGVCAEDTRGDGACDSAFNCAEGSWDSGDCDTPSPGEDCEFGDGSVGVYNCDLECSVASGLGDGYCSSLYECIEFDWDDGDCEAPVGVPCEVSEGVAGVVSCDGTCIEDTTDDAVCDEALSCFELDYDGGACSPDVCFGADYDLGSVLGDAVASGSTATPTSDEVEGAASEAVLRQRLSMVGRHHRRVSSASISLTRPMTPPSRSLTSTAAKSWPAMRTDTALPVATHPTSPSLSPRATP